MFYVEGAKITVFLSICTVLLGICLGIFLALMRLSNSKLLSFIATSYIEFVRGTPVLLQIFIVFYGLPKLGITLPDFAAGVLALTINSGAYVAEIIRSGIQAVNKGQTEAARSLGMSQKMTMIYVILPQAFKNILPALGNEFITVIKESSIVSIIGIQDLMYNADTVRGNIYKPFEPLIFAALIYFVLTFTLSKCLGVVERRMKASD